MYIYEKIPYNLPKEYEDCLEKIETLKDDLCINDRYISERETDELDIWMEDDINHQVRLEGNSLTKKEITYFLSEDITIRGKRFRDFVQVKNATLASSIIRKQLKNNDFTLTENIILFLHKTITEGELPEEESGCYRTEPVHIRYTNYIPPIPEDVPAIMKKLVSEFNEPLAATETMFERICEWKRNFERIHPFMDGNGRTGRLIMNLLFLQNGYGYIKIPTEERDLYFKSLEDNTLHQFLAPKMLNVMKYIQSLHEEQDLSFERR